jgi:YidC/Oxa1 family membrane protein insertase
MDKRVIIIFAATMLMLVFAQQFMVKQQPAKNAPQTAVAPAGAPQPATATTAQAAAADKAAASPAGAAANPAASVQATNECTTVIENDVYQITFTNRGGQVKSWILKKYKADNGQPLDLVNQPAAAQ